MAVTTYKCPHCDGGLIFDPGIQKFHCEFCQSDFTEQELQDTGARPASQTEQKEQKEDGEAVVYGCPSCGAQIVTDATTAATYCYYCHNPVVLNGRLEGAWRPDYIIPFQMEKEQAVEQFLAYMGKKKFIPRAFFAKNQIEKITGVYFPYWMEDYDATADISAKASKVRTWTTGSTQYTETKYYHVARQAHIHFEELFQSALSKNDRQLAQGVWPYSRESMQPFTPAFLPGFQAEKRDIEREQLESQVAAQVDGYAQNLMRGTISGYSGVNVETHNTHIDACKWHYALLPVWVLTYQTKKGKTYYYTMNGQTGKICGFLPVDWGKLALLLAAVFVPVLLLGLLGGYLL